ncbi:hypothetical protein R4Z09_16560 [Niallia oryzisoli]|uniref:Uncharacterized protein n=1 Tax=Niallia oryzisoli TaxID=1737571 RepID=A0ABZ2CAF9_9BACI
MKELVSTCCECGKDIYCLNGFFNGVLTDDKKTLCYDCAEER